jgi:electron transport complex protein RnfG
MKEIVKITIGLAITCLVASIILGAVFISTENARKYNAHVREQETMRALLGYGIHNPAPSDLVFYAIYRYTIQAPNSQHVGYVLPVWGKNQTAYNLLLLNLDGSLAGRYPVSIPPNKVDDEFERTDALKKSLRDMAFSYADSMVVAVKGGKRVAYIIPGKFPGFKTFIQVMLAVGPAFRVLGLEILESEEDPGLGGEIEQDYFKNQFTGKRFERLKSLKVVKAPMPERYRLYLERNKYEETILSKTEIEKIRQIYRDADIYAITGATISSKAVTDGVRAMVKKFAYRIQALDAVITQENIAVLF